MLETVDAQGIKVEFEGWAATRSAYVRCRPYSLGCNTLNEHLVLAHAESYTGGGKVTVAHKSALMRECLCTKLLVDACC